MIKLQVFFLLFLLLAVNSTKAEILTVEVTSEHKDGPVLLAVYDLSLIHISEPTRPY